MSKWYMIKQSLGVVCNASKKCLTFLEKEFIIYR